MIRLPFPSWSWAAWRGGVTFDVKCEEDIKRLVEWHQPIHYAVNKDEPFSEPWYQAADHDALSSAYKDKPNPSSYVVMDERALGFLRFTAVSVTLDIEVMNLDNTQAGYSEDNPVSKDWVSCYIRTRTGKNIGAIEVPSSWLGSRNHKQGECILLSVHIENAESETCPKVCAVEGTDLKLSYKIKDSDDCEHQLKYNVILIDWKEGRHCTVANRVGITHILKKDWVELESSSKVIVLG